MVCIQTKNAIGMIMSLNRLTPAQRAIWASAQMEPENFRFNACFFLDPGKEINSDTLHGALLQLNEEAELQRISLSLTEEGPIQFPYFQPDDLIFRHLFSSEHEAQSWMEQQNQIPLPLDGSTPLLQWHIILLPAGKILLYGKYHHLVLDGFGQSMLIERLAQIYNAGIEHVEPPASEWVTREAYFENLNDYSAGTQHQRDMTFWTTKLASVEGATTLGKSRSSMARGILQTRNTLAQNLYHQIKGFSAEHNLTLPQLLLALFSAYCHRVTGQNIVQIGLAVTGRANLVALKKPSMHANEIPLTLSLAEVSDFHQLLHLTRQELALAVKYQQCRNEDIHRAIGLGAPEEKLTKTLINIISFEHDVYFGNKKALCHQFTTGPVADLTLTLFISTDHIDLLWDANPENYSAIFLDRHAHRFMQFIDWCLTHQRIDCPAETLLLTEDSLAIQQFNTCQQDYDLQQTLLTRIDRQAQYSPEAIALQFLNETITYRELVQRSELWACGLIAQGVRPGDAVGVYGERSLDMTIALLAIQKAGAAYVPLDPELPAARLQSQIQQAGIHTLLYWDAPPDIETKTSALQTQELSNAISIPLQAVSPDAIAYIIFTSGSTGQPKGVAVSHRAVTNRILWMQAAYSLNTDDRVLQKTPFTFDVSVWEFFWPLTVGARLVIAPPGSHKDPRQLIDVINATYITTLHFVPPMLDLFLAELDSQPLASLTRMFCSGEALKLASVMRVNQSLPDCRLHNLYGPTEAAIDVSYWDCTSDVAYAGSVPIGYPVANTQLWVLDAQSRPLPPGAVGELYIGGVQLAQGYINQPQLTAERFIPQPDSLIPFVGEGGRLYRTGDLVRLTEHHGLEFLGRLDHQVKIRGLRIELGEIEAQLMALQQVEQALVSTHSGPLGQHHLVGYLVFADRDANGHSLAEIERQLRTTLPEYMLPTQWVILPALPYLSNGKVDRKALPIPKIVQESGDGELNDQERLIATIWQKVLQRPTLSADMPFYSLGGDSMLAIRVRSELEKSGYSLDLASLFRNPTLRQLAKQLMPVVIETGVPASPAPFSLLNSQDRQRLPQGLEDAYPLSAMQKSMAYQAEIERNTSVYRVVTSLTVELPLKLPLLQRAIDCTLARHPLLRSSFDLSNYSQPLQLIHQQVETPFESAEDLTLLASEQQQQAILRWIEQAKCHRFDLAQAPCLAFFSHSLHPQRFQLSVIEHHVVLDGWSDLIMLDEIIDNYQLLLDGFELQPVNLVSQYSDFIVAEQQIMADRQAAAYWQSQLTELDPAPLPRPDKVGPTRHKSLRAELPAALSNTLEQLVQTYSLPLKALLVAAHLKVQAVLTGQARVATGLVFNGRLGVQDADKTIGVFLNTLPLALSIEQVSFIDLARQIAQFEADAYPYGRYPFTAMQRDYGQEIVLDSYINYMDFHRNWGNENSPISHAHGVADTNFALAVNFLKDPVSQSLSLWFDCNLALLSEPLCDLLPEYYLQALSQLTGNPQQLVFAASLQARGQQELIRQWNHTDVAYEADDCAYRQFERQAVLNPQREALCCRDDSLSYSELNQLSNTMASRLREAGVTPGSLVGICLPRSVMLVASLLAIHKAGAAYVPLDPGYPVERLNYIVKDSQLSCLITQPDAPLLSATTRIEWPEPQELLREECQDPPQAALGNDIAYVIYTSGSTGKPKGTVILQKNLTNFLVGMDDAVECRQDDSLLALTSVSFDISILEIFWPLSRGAKLVLAPEHQINNLTWNSDSRKAPLDFSLFFFGAANNERRHESYQLVLDVARYADNHGFKAIWTPERHFHAFGGLYPNPSIMSAALATITKQVELRCGSVVAPLHDSLRLAEEWSLVDNLSAGRVGLALASGWNTNDFALAPDNYQTRKAVMLQKLQELRTLWQGGHLKRTNGDGKEVNLTVYPSPVQSQLPIWFTSSGDVTTFELAGTYGVNLLTHLLGQDVEQLQQKITAYRQAWHTAGHAGDGHVTLMVHTFLLPDEQRAKEVAKDPFREYLRTSTGLLRELSASMGLEFQANLPQEDMESLLDMAVERYFERSGLFGSPESVQPLLTQLQLAGIDELAGLIDFGIANEQVLEGLHSLKQLQTLHRNELRDAEHNFAALLQRHRISMVQSTPSFMAAVMAEPAAVCAMGNLRAILIGGEPFPAGLAQQLSQQLDATVYNMYGPTETTIWSSVHRLPGKSSQTVNRIAIGKPIANTQMLILSPTGHPSPIGVAGELWIGGDGVCQGYWGRPELTAERFVLQPDIGRVFYRTGDRALWNTSGEVEFIGRIDRQVKVLGHRIELDEIESVISRHPQVQNAAVIAVKMENERYELAAYVEINDVQQQVGDSASTLIAHWGTLWNNAYQERASYKVRHEQDRQFAGWLSSYTGTPIPPEEMHEWLNHTLSKLRACDRSHLIDVGVGMGQIMRHLAVDSHSYHGLDLSQEALDVARQSLPSALHSAAHITLTQGDAKMLGNLAARPDTLVILNSVIQYFPDISYLKSVLQEALRITHEDGMIYLGDIRSLDDLPTFHTSVQFYKAAPLARVAEIRQQIKRDMETERELCLSPQFFQTFNQRYETSRKLQLELKRGRASNELNDFRYDVIISCRKQNTAPRYLDWQGSPFDLQRLAALTAQLHDENREKHHIVIRNLPNHRLQRDSNLVALLADAHDDQTKWDIEKLLWEVTEPDQLHPEDIAGHFEAQGYQVRLTLNPEEGLRLFNLELTLHTAPLNERRQTSALAESK